MALIMERNSEIKTTSADPSSRWLVTYRGRDGKQLTMELEAADRSDLFRILEEKHISAIRIEPATGKRKAKIVKGSPSVAIKGALAAAIVIFGAFAVWFIISHDTDDKKESIGHKRSTITETVAKPAKSIKVEYEKPEKTGDKLKDALAEVSAAEQALTIKAAPKITIPSGYTNRTFKTGVEQLMSWVFSVEVGDMPMPIPPIGEEDRAQLASILASKNEIKEGDSKMAAFCKEQVDFAKEEMREFIKQGGDPDEFLQYYFNQLRHAFEFRNEAQQQYYDLLEEDPELAEEFAKRVNKSFDEKGIKHIFTEQEELEAEEQ